MSNIITIGYIKDKEVLDKLLHISILDIELIDNLLGILKDSMPGFEDYVFNIDKIKDDKRYENRERMPKYILYQNNKYWFKTENII